MTEFIDLFNHYRWVAQLLISAGLLVVYSVLHRVMSGLIQNWGRQSNIKAVRIEQVVRYFKALLILVTLAFIALVWGVDYRGLWLVATSLVAVLGVALFAQWSILSNVTSGVIVFFTFPAKVGDRIQIIDGDNSVKGLLQEIGMFQIQIKDDEDNIVVYPNNLLLQKPVRKLQALADKKTDSKGWLIRQKGKSGQQG